MSSTNFSNIANMHLLTNSQECKGFPTLPVDGSGRVVGFNPNYVCSPLATFPTPATSPTAPTSSDLVETRNETFLGLEASLNRNVIDIYQAGKAIHFGYARAERNITDQVNRFVQKYCSRVHNTMMPPPTPTIDNEYVWIMMHGYGLVAQLSLTAAHMFKNRTDSDSMDLGAITGAFCNVNASVVRRYPAEAPFSGEAIDMKSEMPRRKNQQAHVYVKKLIFTLLSRACTLPTDIQDVTWMLPDDSGSSRSANPVPFPRGLFDDMQEIILEYFQLDDERLCRGMYDEEWCHEMNCLKGIADPAARKNRYFVMHKARRVFLSSTFHHQFKAALSDLKRSIYIPPPHGQRFGTFKLLSHNKRPRVDEEDHQ